MQEIKPEDIVVLHLQPNDTLFVNDECFHDLESLRGAFECPIIPVHPRPGMTVADELIVIRNEI